MYFHIVQRVPMATFWRTLHHEVDIRVCTPNPLNYVYSPSRTKLYCTVVYAPSERAYTVNTPPISPLPLYLYRKICCLTRDIRDLY
jgi:hypothetical protein